MPGYTRSAKLEIILAFVAAVALFLCGTSFANWFSVVGYVAAVLWGLTAGRLRGAKGLDLAGFVLRYLLFFSLGLGGVFTAMGHLFFAKEVAASIGWATSPFQFEVGMANLGFGLAGLLALFFGPGYWFGAGLGPAVFLLGAAYGHTVQMRAGDFAINNAGPIFYTDMLIPLTFLALALAVGVGARKKTTG